MPRVICEICNGSEYENTKYFFICKECGKKYTRKHIRDLIEVALISDMPTIQTNHGQIKPDQEPVS